MHSSPRPFSETSESLQFRICRVLCIFLMISVHINPGISIASVVSTGEFAWLGSVWVNFLGRASVATLSFLSGYLIIRTASASSLAEVARKRFGSLIVPMLVWNLIFCLLLLVKVRVVGQSSSHPIWRPDADLPGLLTGLTSATANQSLAFLRDIFVSLLLVKVLAPWLRRWPIAVLGVVLALTVFDLTDPLVLRPSILFFVVAGAACAQRAQRLADFLTPGRMVLSGAIILGALAILSTAQGGVVSELKDVLRRCLLLLLMLSASAALIHTATGKWIARFEPRIFEAYLLHVPLCGILWVAWTYLVGGPTETSYLVFFLGMPVVAIVAGQIVGRICDDLPASAQKIVRGKARPSRRPILAGTGSWAKAVRAFPGWLGKRLG